MSSFKDELEALYKDGKNEEILSLIAAKYSSLDDIPASTLVIKGWAHYPTERVCRGKVCFYQGH